MRTLFIEFKRMFFEKKLMWLLIVTIIYVTICSLFWNLRFKLDYGYAEISYDQSAFKLWQDTVNTGYMTALMQIVPSMIYIFSFIDDRKNGIDNQICIKNHSNIYYIMKYMMVIIGGMLYNFLSVVLIYIPLYFMLSTGNGGWNYLDRENALIGKFFTGNTAIEFVLIIALCYSFVGGVCAAMSCVISLWIDNRVVLCIMPYIIFRILGTMLRSEKMTVFSRIILGDVDWSMEVQPFIYYVYYFVWWILLLSILFIISYIINIEKKR